MKSFLSFSIITTLSVSMPISVNTAAADSNPINTTSQVFQDVPLDFPDVTGIDFVSTEGIMNGYPDGTFKPFGNLTRAELAVTLVRLMGEDTLAKAGANEPLGFTDDSSIPDWARGSIYVLKSKGIMNGYPDGSFKPDDQLDQAALLKVLVGILGFPNLYSDLGWPNQYIKAGRLLYLLTEPDGVTWTPIEPDSPASRGLTAKLIYRAAILASGDDVTEDLHLTYNSPEYKMAMALGLYGQNYIKHRLPASFMGIVTNFSSDTVTITSNILWPQKSALPDENTEVTFTYGKNVFLDTTESKKSIHSLGELKIGSFATVVLGKDGLINYLHASEPMDMNLPTSSPSSTVPAPSTTTPPPLTGTISSDDTHSRIFLTIKLVGPKGESQPFQAILDTGGDIGGFPKAILDQLGYQPISQGIVTGPGGQGQAANVYKIQYPLVLDNGQWVPLGKGSMITIGFDDNSVPPLVPPTIFKDNSGLSLSISGSKWTLTFPPQ